MLWVIGYSNFQGGSQSLELQQRYFKDLSGGLDQHMRSLTHLLAALGGHARFRQAGLAAHGVMNTTRGCVGVLIA